MISADQNGELQENQINHPQTTTAASNAIRSQCVKHQVTSLLDLAALKRTPTVTLYTRDNCKLCNPVRFICQKLKRRKKFFFKEINIDADGQEAARQLYTNDVPVVTLNGVEIARHRLDEFALLRALQGNDDLDGSGDALALLQPLKPSPFITGQANLAQHAIALQRAALPQVVRSMRGRLLIASMPIGNPLDISERLIREIQSADSVYCENTLHTSRLLRAIGDARGRSVIHTRCPLRCYNGMPSGEHADQVMERIISLNESVVYVTDAGTPAISDPGFELVRIAHEHNALCDKQQQEAEDIDEVIQDSENALRREDNALLGPESSVDPTSRVEISALPGPSACMTALVLSGMSSGSGQFAFFGFWPRTDATRTTMLKRLINVQMVSVFFESPHRIEETLHHLERTLPRTVHIAVARDMTKPTQQVARGTVQEVRQQLTQLKGEFALVLPVFDALVESKTLMDEFNELTRAADGLTAQSPLSALDILAQRHGMDKLKVKKLLKQHTKRKHQIPAQNKVYK